MSNQGYDCLIITGVLSDADDLQEDIIRLHRQACELLATDMVSPISGPGHNCIASFFVHPSGSSEGRDAHRRHAAAIDAIVAAARKCRAIDFARIGWRESLGEAPTVTDSHEHHEHEPSGSAPLPATSN